MGRNLIETIMGAVVLLVAAFFLVFAYRQADVGVVKGYTVKASFLSVGGLANGGDVRINGIKVGSVMDQTIDASNFDAVVRMSIRPDIHLPADTVASIATDGLLGGKYVKLDPGRSRDIIPADGTIANTKNFKSLEEMVGEIIFLATDSGGPKAGASPAVAPAPAAGGGDKPAGSGAPDGAGVK
jgi:phospholipid/cholesterol/gamma-HCH transport system substrate-binding protein